MKRYASLFAILLLVGCSTISDLYSDYPRQVALLQASLTTAEHAALIYVKRPVCGKTSAVICRTPEITKKIGAYDEAAYTAVMAARKASDETSLEAARTAVGAFREIGEIKSIINSLPAGEQ